MIEDKKQPPEAPTLSAEQLAKTTEESIKKPSSFPKLKLSKRTLIITAASVVVLFAAAFGIIHAATKKHPSNYVSGDAGKSQQKSTAQPGITADAALPFANTMQSNGLLAATVNGQSYPVEFTSWGAHSLPHAGGHVEGNNKSNFRIHILPKGKTVEMSGNSNGACDSGELCGVTAADAKANAPWYIAENKGMTLIAVEHDQANQDLSPYIPGETTQWRLYFSFEGGLDLNLQHTGEISPELLQLIHASGQDSILEATQYTKLSKPVDVPLGTKLARPQIIGVQSKVVGGQTVYQADAQTEWSVTPTMVTSKAIGCQWKYFPASLQKRLQTAMNIELTHPDPHGLFSGSGSSTSVGVEGAAEGSLCASDSIAYDNYTKISSNDSFGYYQVNDATQATGEVMAVYPIGKTSAAYSTNKSSYASSSVDFMFRRGADVSGFADTHNFSFSLKQGSKTYTMHDLSGEVVDMAAKADTAQNDHFTVRIDRGDNGETAASMPLGKYVGVRYKIEKDKVIAQYGELADTAAAVKLPSPIPETATCSASYVCYIHDFSLLKR